MAIFDPDQWGLIQDIQRTKRSRFGLSGIMAIHGDANTMINPITGQAPSKEDLLYAKEHIDEIYNSDQIKESRWAFLWYH